MNRQVFTTRPRRGWRDAGTLWRAELSAMLLCDHGRFMRVVKDFTVFDGKMSCIHLPGLQVEAGEVVEVGPLAFTKQWASIQLRCRLAMKRHEVLAGGAGWLYGQVQGSTVRRRQQGEDTSSQLVKVVQDFAPGSLRPSCCEWWWLGLRPAAHPELCPGRFQLTPWGKAFQGRVVGAPDRHGYFPETRVLEPQHGFEALETATATPPIRTEVLETCFLSWLGRRGAARLGVAFPAAFPRLVSTGTKLPSGTSTLCGAPKRGSVPESDQDMKRVILTISGKVGAADGSELWNQLAKVMSAADANIEVCGGTFVQMQSDKGKTIEGESFSVSAFGAYILPAGLPESDGGKTHLGCTMFVKAGRKLLN
eukprot:Skav219605  [mRNA]  locus=scaffold628:40490:46818:- [translate_table: standard]